MLVDIWQGKKLHQIQLMIDFEKKLNYYTKIGEERKEKKIYGRQLFVVDVNEDPFVL